MRQTVIILGLVVLACVLLDNTAYVGKPEVEISVTEPASGRNVEDLSRSASFPVVLDYRSSRGIAIDISTNGWTHTGQLVVVATGGGLWLEHGVSRTDLGKNSKGCRSTGADSYRCTVVVSTSRLDKEILTLYPADLESVNLSAVAYRALSSKRASSASSSLILWGFLVLLAAGPALVWIRRACSVRVEEWLLITLGAFWLWVASGHAALLVLVVLAGIYLAALVMQRTGKKNQLLLPAIMLTVLALFAVKFAFPAAAGAFADPGGFGLALPLGASYFAIRAIDLFMACRAGAVGELDLRGVLAFMLFPPTLAAGPITTYGDFRTSTIGKYGLVDWAAGAARMAGGCGKKLLADLLVFPAIGKYGKLVMQDGLSEPGGGYILAMLVLTFIYVYLDFSAYSDMAVGSGRAMGRRVPENFDWPLLRSGLRSYWRCWHMSLSSWVMRRVYLPAFLQCRSGALATFAAMLTIGVWHLPSLSWILWAVHHSLALVAEARVSERLPAVVASVPSETARRGLQVFAIGFTWLWVSLGHSFTIFSDVDFALRIYGKALSSLLFLG